MKRLIPCFWMLALMPFAKGTVLEAIDPSGRTRPLNPSGKVSVVIYSNPAVQDRTRTAGASLDTFQGRLDFHATVVVDLRGTLATLAKGYTKRRILEDLDLEAKRIEAAFRRNNPGGNPRDAVSAIPDFKGDLCEKLRWLKPENRLRAIVFGYNGDESLRWEDLRDPRQLRDHVAKLLDARH